MKQTLQQSGGKVTLFGFQRLVTWWGPAAQYQRMTEYSELEGTTMF